MGYPSWDPGGLKKPGKARALARLVRPEHTVFSLPFAYAGATLSGYGFTLSDAALMALAVLGLRTAAMAFNNIADLDLDKLNPRTRNRPLVTGAVSLPEAWAVVAAGLALYLASAAFLNKYALLLSPIPLAIALTYPYAKRLHPLPHLHLGLALGMVVFGGAVAASGDEAGGLAEVLGSVPWLLVAAVALWVAGFDVIYSLMDLEFDRRYSVKSIPALLGPRHGLLVAAAMHASSVYLLAASIASYGLGATALYSVALATALLAAQLALAWRGRVVTAFNLNLAVSLILGLGLSLEGLLGERA